MKVLFAVLWLVALPMLPVCVIKTCARMAGTRAALKGLSPASLGKLEPMVKKHANRMIPVFVVIWISSGLSYLTSMSMFQWIGACFGVVGLIMVLAYVIVLETTL